jgi:hypothetical protein
MEALEILYVKTIPKLCSKAKFENHILCLVILDLDKKSVLTSKKLTSFTVCSSGNKSQLFSLLLQFISQSPLRRINFTSRTLGAGVNVNVKFSLKQKS